MRARLNSRSRVVAACSVVSLLALAGFANPPAEVHPNAAPSVKPSAKQPAAKPEAKRPAAPAKPAQEEPAHEEAAQIPAPAPVAPVHEAAPVETHAAALVGDSAPTAADALRLLREGNERWINNQASSPNTDTARREETASAGQKPFATILTCADSRLPAERLFDRGVGDLFVVRVAGNVVSPEVAGTIEYGAEHLDVPLLVVMGHTKCGAVAAAASEAKIEGNVGTLVDRIAPAVARARQQNPGAEGSALASAAVKENVWQGIFDLLRTSPEVRHLVQSGKLEVIGAVCDVATGKVEWLGAHPWQDALVEAFEAKKSHASPATADAGDGH
jgi:carbonic anhydrase